MKPSIFLSKTVWISYLLILAIWGFLAYLQPFSPIVQYDDAYITFRYVYNFIHHHQIVYNLGDYTEGFTNFFRFLVVALFSKSFSFEIATVSMSLSYITIMAFLLCITRLLGFLFYDLYGATLSYAQSGFFFFILGSLSFSTMTISTLISGLEMPESITVLAVLLVFFYSQKTNQVNYKKIWEYAAYIACFISYSIRPDLILYVGALLTAAFFYEKNLSLKSLTPLQKKILICLGLLLTGFFALTVWRYYYFHDLVPNTFYAKTGTRLGKRMARAFSSEYHDASLYSVFNRYFDHRLLKLGGGRALAEFMMIGTAVSIYYFRRRISSLFAICTISLWFISILYYSYTGGDVFLLRFLLMATYLSVIYLFLFAGDLFFHHRKIISIVIFVILLATIRPLYNFFIVATVTKEKIARNTSSQSIDVVTSQQAYGVMLSQIAKGDTLRVATSGGGSAFYYPQFKAVEVFGLTDKVIAKHGKDFVSDNPGHERTDVDYIFNQFDPDVLIMNCNPEGLQYIVSSPLAPEINQRYTVLLNDKNVIDDKKFVRAGACFYVKNQLADSFRHAIDQFIQHPITDQPYIARIPFSIPFFYLTADEKWESDNALKYRDNVVISSGAGEKTFSVQKPIHLQNVDRFKSRQFYIDYGVDRVRALQEGAYFVLSSAGGGERRCSIEKSALHSGENHLVYPLDSPLCRQNQQFSWDHIDGFKLVTPKKFKTREYLYNMGYQLVFW